MPSGPSRSRPSIACLLAPALIALTLAACDRQSGGAGQDVPANAIEANAVTSDEVPETATDGAAPVTPAGKLDRSHKGEAAPALAFTAPDGKRVTLADFRGKPLLVNLWATWCAPCVAELPTLDTAAGTLGDRVRILTIAEDLGGKAKVEPFLAAKGYKHLEPYLDPDLGLSLAYKANLPTTVLYDAQGREVWRMTGGYEWNTPEAEALIGEGA